MKFRSQLTLLALTAGLIVSMNQAEPAADVKEKLAAHGFSFGRVNHLPSDAVFDAVISIAQNVIVKFGANWCGPCRQITPVLEDLAKNYPDVLVVEVNIDQFPQFKSRYGFRSIPAIFLLKNGEKTSRTIGFKPFTYWAGKFTTEFGITT